MEWYKGKISVVQKGLEKPKNLRALQFTHMQNRGDGRAVVVRRRHKDEGPRFGPGT